MVKITKESLDVIFNTARTYITWQKKDVEDSLIKEMYDLLKMGPTSVNCCPARILFVKSAAAKERLKPCLDNANIDKTMSAPVTAIIGYDTEFYEKLPFLFPHFDVRSWFIGNENLTNETATYNSTLQAAYLIIAARSLGLDCGPMAGFNKEMVEKEFFPNSKIKAGLLCNIGYGDPSGLYPRGPRLSFDEACNII